MPVKPTYPGVYVQEIPSGSRTITGVSTSVTAFIGYFTRGDMNEPTQILSYSDFEREFGGLNRESEASFAIKQFFDNGGTEAWVVRAADGADKAGIVLLDSSGDTALEVEAANEGTWGNSLRLTVDYETTEPGQTFNLTVEEYDDPTKAPVNVETYRNLSPDSSSARHVASVVNEESTLIGIVSVESNRPVEKMGTWGTVDPVSLSTTSDLSGPVDTGQLTDQDHTFDVTITEVDGDSLSSATESKTVTVESNSTVEEILSAFESALQEIDGLEQTAVEVTDDDTVRVLLPVQYATATVSFADDSGSDLITSLGLDAPGTTNVQKYSLGIPETMSGGGDLTIGALEGGGAGDDGSTPTATQLLGSAAAKTGIYALEDVDLFNILCIPRTAEMSDADAISVIDEGIGYCAEQRAFMIVDIPNNVDTVEEVKDWVSNNGNTLRGDQADHAALYFPRVRISNPLDEYRPRSIPTSGTLAGLYSRIDTNRGVWKAPAGTEATLRGIRSLEYRLSDRENGVLNPLGINALRVFDVRGTVSWGGRTLRGADQLADEYKYIPVRRLALYLEESLFRGLQWVVFEPNDEPLWAQIRMNVNEFMQRLFQQGAFQGTSPDEAYFVKCDSETTTQSDIDRGIVNIVVGFAPLKPAEFVILKIQQKAGQE
jgi:phage tail sheath protein FI